MEHMIPDFLKDKADGHIKLEKTAPKIKVDGAETPSWLPTGQITLDDQRKNMSGWSGLTGQSRLNSQRMANMFDGLRITGGQRTKEQQRDAMVKKGSLDVYGKWFRKAGLEDFEISSTPGSPERKNAVKKIQDAGFVSNHRHGNAIDFSYPKGFSKKTFGNLKAKLEDAFPGSKLLEEGNHLHLAFKPGVAPDQISAGMNKLHEGNNTFAGAPSTYNIVTNNNISSVDGDTMVMAPGSARNPKNVND